MKTSPFLFIVCCAVWLFGLTEASAFYNPETGRFLSMDPIEESGGINLYGFVNNDPINKWDYLGLEISRFSGSPSSMPVQPVPENQFNDPSASGETQKDWSVKATYSSTWSTFFGVGNTCSLKSSGQLRLTLVRKQNRPEDRVQPVRSPGDPIMPNPDPYQTLGDHERSHAEIYAGYWNQMADQANKYEGEYCPCNCAKLGTDIIYSLSGLYLAKAQYDNARYDNAVYGVNYVFSMSRRVDAAKEKLRKAIGAFEAAKRQKPK